MEHTYRRQIFEHLGLVAGMVDALGMGDGVDNATPQTPAMRDLTVGEAVDAMVLKGLGCANHALDLVPRVFEHTPTSRLMAPRVPPTPLHAEALGRALDTLDADGVTALYRLLAATAATRLGLAAPLAHRETTRLHVDGRDNSAAAPAAAGMHSTRGDRREHRPDLNHVLREVIVAHQAGLPGLMPPRSGPTRAGTTVGPVVKASMTPLHTPSGTPERVAASALDHADHRQQLAATTGKGLTRVPATLHAAPAARAPATPQPMAPLTAGARDPVLPATSGGVQPRWLRLAAEPRDAHAQRPVDQQRRQPRAPDGNACKPRWRPPLAGAAEAHHALTTCSPRFQATCLHPVTGWATPRDGTRGRPRPDTPPAHVVSRSAGALAAARTTRQARLDPHRCVILATHELEAATWPPPEVRNGDTRPAQTDRGGRVLKAPHLLASALYLKRPARSMALVMVMTVCLLV
jgi:Domain of unknown function (DUF4277)